MDQYSTFNQYNMGLDFKPAIQLHSFCWDGQCTDAKGEGRVLIFGDKLNLIIEMRNETRFGLESASAKSGVSVGVGDKEMYLHCDVMEWTAIYLQQKFFIADPESISKLLEIQAQIELEKQLAESVSSEQERAESFHSYYNKHNKANESYVTQVNLQRQKLNGIKVEQELEREEELYAKRVAEARNKKKEEKRKGNKNLVKFGKEKEDYKSVKMEKPENETKGHDQLKKSVVDVQIVGRIQKQRQSHAERSQQVAVKEVQNQMVETVGRKLNQQQIFAEQAPIKDTKIIPNLSQKMVINSIIQIKIQETRQQVIPQNKSLLISHVKAIQVENDCLSPQLKKKDPSILSVESSVEKKIDRQMNQQRAGDSFFYNLHSKIDELQHNLQGAKEKQMPKQTALKTQQIVSPEVVEKREFKFQESTIMINTKNLLKDLNKQLKEIGMIEPQQDSCLTSEKAVDNVLQNKNSYEHEDNHNKIEATDVLKQLKEQKRQEKQLKIYKNFQMQETIKVNIEPLHKEQTKVQQKRDHCRIFSSLLSHQIVQVAPRGESDSNLTEKEKLNDQIYILKQVIGELRVQRLKYQSFEKADESGTVQSNCHKTQREAFRQKPIGHHITGSIFNNFDQSAVSEVHSNQNRSMIAKKTVSGRIIKNYSPMRMMKIDEERDMEFKQQQIKEVQETQQRQSENSEMRQQSKETSRQLMDGRDAKSIKIPTGSQEVSQTIQQKQEVAKDIQMCSLVNDSEAVHNFSKVKQAVVTQIIQAVNNSPPLQNESYMQSSMPKPLNRHNHSQPPRFIIQEHQNHQKRYESNIKKKLINNFDQLQTDNPKKYSTVIHEEKMDPKRRANKDGIIKQSQSKPGVYHPDLNKIVFGGAQTNLKSKIMEIQQTRREKAVKAGSNAVRKNSMNESNSSKGFRLRRQSQASRQSRVSSTKKQGKSTQKKSNLKVHQPIKVYVPALKEKEYQPMETPQTEEKLDVVSKELKEQEQFKDASNFKVKHRKINFNIFEIPTFPEPPNPSIKIQEMAELIMKLNKLLHLQLKQNELYRLIMKKYKNCIMIDLPNAKDLKMVWHYNGKLQIGEWNEANMLKTGEGLEYVPQKYFYRGQFQNGKRHGSGVMVQQSGNIYEGQWADGEKNGRGKYYDASIKLSYEGEWKNGKKEGFGYIHIDNHSTYEGTFLENHKQGQGIEELHNGDSYKGQYLKGRFHGKGIYIWASGDRYQGEFYEGCKHGEGKWTSFIGQVYEGSYKLDKKSGGGKYSWGNGCVYEGQFYNDKKNGNGILRYPDGRQMRGIWQEGKLVQEFQSPRKNDKQQPLNPRKSKAQTLRIQPKAHHSTIRQKM